MGGSIINNCLRIEKEYYKKKNENILEKICNIYIIDKNLTLIGF